MSMIEPSLLISSYQLSDYNGYNVSCSGYNDGAIDFTVNGSVPPYSYVWSNGLVSQDVSGLGSGTYSLVIHDLNMCTNFDTIVLSEPSPLLDSIILSDYNGYNISCNGYNDGFIDLLVSGSVPPYSYQWNNGTVLQDLNFVGSGNYSVTVTDDNNCIVNRSLNLIEPTILFSGYQLSDYNGYNISCNGFDDGSIDLSVSGSVPPYSYQWSNGANSQDIFQLVAGEYSIKITDSNNCVFNTDIQIVEADSLRFLIQTSTDTCNRSIGYGKVNPYGGVPPYSYLWSNNMSSQEINNLYQGNYIVWLSDANNCEDIQYFSIQNLPKPTADFTVLPSKIVRYYSQIDKPIQFLDNSIDSWCNLKSWYWSFGDGSYENTINTSHSFLQWGDYDVELIVENEFGCFDTIVKRVIIKDFVLYIPNSFTPNFDGLNDEFIVKGLGVSTFKIDIYNRWGGICFSSNDLNQSWNGIDGLNNDPIVGMYLYVVEVLDIFGDSHIYRGKIKLIN